MSKQGDVSNAPASGNGSTDQPTVKGAKKQPKRSNRRRNNNNKKSDEAANGKDIKPKTPINNRNARNTRTSKNESLNKTNQNTTSMKNPSFKSEETLMYQKQRQEEIEQCLHMLGKDNFKLFRNGKYVTSYSIRLKVIEAFKNDGLKFTVNIPHDYPRASIKLSSNKSNSQEQSDDDTLNMFIRNFNLKARQMNSDKLPIITQINYLSEDNVILLKKDFRNLDRMKQNFYSRFIEST